MVTLTICGWIATHITNSVSDLTSIPSIHSCNCPHRHPVCIAGFKPRGSEYLTSGLVVITQKEPAMAYVVCEPCRDCKYTDCVVVCPCECFYQDDRMLYIDPEHCIDCDACRAECPVDAIFPDV